MTSTTSRKRRPYATRVPAEERRTQLLDAALRLIVTSGHDAVTMDALAERAGVTKPVIYGQFSGRADLLDALLRREQRAALSQLFALIPAETDMRAGEPARLVTETLDRFLRTVRETPDRWYCIVMPLPDMPSAFHRARDEARDAVLRRAREIAEWGQRRVDGFDPEIAGHTIVTLFEMAARLVLTDPERYRPERFVGSLRAAIGLVTPRVGL
ncbi:TetR family transcriptional regulator [Herbihabitans rhizosphaerae]|uniref:TetR family transcriptional regulator n=1 Tax=Herbihabitans rhizosphaerae TaxID=1872711 RepID=A0A4V2ERG3_9PSEU|nr:TetR/AcrR family transcriptional regulator [Herbihabitans rhizosphaerae]RZS31213.1 TetR family transcriptional regulator [Herbihabitans rhizosphaerae]